MIPGELVVIEVFLGRLVAIADVDDGDRRIVELFGAGIAPADGSALFRNQNAAGEEVVFVGASWVGDDFFDH